MFGTSILEATDDCYVPLRTASSSQLCLTLLVMVVLTLAAEDHEQRVLQCDRCTLQLKVIDGVVLAAAFAQCVVLGTITAAEVPPAASARNSFRLGVAPRERHGGCA